MRERDAWGLILVLSAITIVLIFLVGCDRVTAPQLSHHSQPNRQSQQLAIRTSPNQSKRWEQAKLRPAVTIRIDKLIDRYLRSQSRYDVVRHMRANGVPSPVIFSIHYREGDNAFSTNLANGDSLLHRTIHVPRGRLPDKSPPYTWEVAAEDALYVVDHENSRNWGSLGPALQAIEDYNGRGYMKRGLPSPYLWSGTTIYERGKYTSDGRYDPMAVDGQIGVAAILIRMRERGLPQPW